MNDPYRSRILPSVSFDPLWTVIERKRRASRALPIALALLIAGPIVLITARGVLNGRVPGYSSHPTLHRSVFDPHADPWGFAVSPMRVHAWSGPLPLGVDRPDRDASLTPLPTLQQALADQASDRIRLCYETALDGQPDLAGDLIVHIASHGGRTETAVTGPVALREAVGGCVRRAVDDVRFPLVKNDIAWLHLPIRFASR